MKEQGKALPEWCWVAIYRKMLISILKDSVQSSSDTDSITKSTARLLLRSQLTQCCWHLVCISWHLASISLMR